MLIMCCLLGHGRHAWYVVSSSVARRCCAPYQFLPPAQPWPLFRLYGVKEHARTRRYDIWCQIRGWGRSTIQHVVWKELYPEHESPGAIQGSQRLVASYIVQLDLEHLSGILCGLYASLRCRCHTTRTSFNNGFPFHDVQSCFLFPPFACGGC
jgi:hypothetical protein